jgi:chromosome segregation ATPase
MSIRETIESAIQEIETSLAAREESLQKKETGLIRRESEVAQASVGFEQKEKSLLAWEQTLTDREAQIKRTTQTLAEQSKELEKTQKAFKEFRSQEISRIENESGKIAAYRKALESQKDSFESEKKQQDTIRAKLVSEREALDAAWNELKWNNLKTHG